jgi:hypothetical protein
MFSSKKHTPVLTAVATEQPSESHFASDNKNSDAPRSDQETRSDFASTRFKYIIVLSILAVFALVIGLAVGLTRKRPSDVRCKQICII